MMVVQVSMRTTTTLMMVVVMIMQMMIMGQRNCVDLAVLTTLYQNKTEKHASLQGTVLS
jgi:hypothetical protein